MSIWARPPILAVIVLLALGQFGWQAAGTYAWSRWVDAWRMVLGNHQGLIPWQTAKQELGPLLPATGVVAVSLALAAVGYPPFALTHMPATAPSASSACDPCTSMTR